MTDRAAIYADVETTGFSTEKNQIVEVGLAAFHGAQEIGTFHSLVHATDEAIAAGADALEKNHINPDDLRTAPLAIDVAELMWQWLRPILAAFPELRLHSFNVPFDRRFMACDPWFVERELWGECVMDASMRAMGQHRYPRLSDAIEYFKVQPEGDAHRALPDARMAAKVHLAILEQRAKEAMTA